MRRQAAVGRPSSAAGQSVAPAVAIRAHLRHCSAAAFAAPRRFITWWLSWWIPGMGEPPPPSSSGAAASCCAASPLPPPRAPPAAAATLSLISCHAASHPALQA